MTVFLMLTLVACGGDLETASVSTEDFIPNFEETISTVENYEIDTMLELTIESNGETSNALITMEGILYEDLTNAHLYFSITENGIEHEQEAYFKDEFAYINDNNTGWRLENNLGPTETDTSYSNVANGILEIADLLSVTEHDDTYELTYEGTDASVFDAFQNPYDLSLTGVDKETDLTMTLSIVIDQETYLMEDFSLIIDVEHEQGNMNFDIRSLFTNINQISEIELPNEILEATSNNNEEEQDIAESEIQSENENENADFFQEFYQTYQQIENYEIDVSLNLFARLGDEVMDAILSLSGPLYEDLSASHIELSIEQNGENQHLEYYQLDGYFYLNEDQTGWVMMPDNSEITDSDTNYTNIANGLFEVAPLLEIEESESGDQYVILYSGNDSALYYAFQAPFDLSLPEIDMNQLDISLHILVDKESYYMTSFALDIVASEDDMDALFDIDVQFNQINNVGEITLPEEVQTEAESN